MITKAQTLKLSARVEAHREAIKEILNGCAEHLAGVSDDADEAIEALKRAHDALDDAGSALWEVGQ